MGSQRGSFHTSSALRAGTAVAFSLALVAATMLPVGAEHVENPRNGLEEIGFHDLGGDGFNTDIMPWTTEDGRLFAASGTWGTLTGFANPGQECPSETDNPLAPTKSGVKVVDATDPTNPVMAARIGTIPGSQNNDLKVRSIDTASFTGDILVHSLEPCGAEGILAQIPGAPASSLIPINQTGFVIYDVTEPTGPVELGRFNNSDLGVHNLYIFTQPDPNNAGKQRAYVAVVWTEVILGGLGGIRSELQIVDITDPTAVLPLGVTMPISTWELADAAGQGGPSEADMCKERGRHFPACLLHDVWVSDDGTTAYLSFWDAGLILLDVTDPNDPQFLGQVQSGDPNDPINEGNTHAAVPLPGTDLVIVGDEDFVGGGTVGVNVNAPASLSGVKPATQWSGTAPVQGDPVHTADLVYAGTGCLPGDYAAATAIHGQSFNGKIALVDKFDPVPPYQSTCPTFTFFQKMQAAEAAGAIGLVQIDNDDAPSGGDAISSSIPGLEISNTDGTPLREAFLNGETVNGTLGRFEPIDPWGFMRVFDASNPAAMTEVSTFKAPHVEDPNPGPEDVFSAHNPIVGPDGRVYFSWYTNGVRVLEVSPGGGVNETAWFVPLPSDHPDDNDSDPHGAQEDNVGFWGSWPICDPNSGDLLVFNSDLNRGMYILRATYEHDCVPEPTVPSKVTGGGQVPGSTGGGLASFGFNARQEGSEAKGHISVRDHGTGQHVLSASINVVTELESDDGRRVRVRGTCRLNGGDPQPCEVLAVDRGERGDMDEFHIEVRTAGGVTLYSAGGQLERGNVKVH